MNSESIVHYSLRRILREVFMTFIFSSSLSVLVVIRVPVVSHPVSLGSSPPPDYSKRGFHIRDSEDHHGDHFDEFAEG